MHIIDVWKNFSNFALSVKAGKPTADHNRSSYTYCVIDYSGPGGIWGRTFFVSLHKSRGGGSIIVFGLIVHQD